MPHLKIRDELQSQKDGQLSVCKKKAAKKRARIYAKTSNLAAFQDANRDLASAVARTTERRLNSE